MKKSILTLLLLTFILGNSFGQWYTKKYQVSDINLLSEKQMEESIKDSKNSSLAGILTAGIGGLIYILGSNSVFELSDNPTLLEQLMGKKGINDCAMVMGAGMMGAGVIVSISYEGRIGKIKSALSKKTPSTGSIRISPKLFPNRYTGSMQPGILMTLNF